MADNYDRYITGGKSHTLSEVIAVYKQDEVSVRITFRSDSVYGFCPNTENLGTAIHAITIDGSLANPGDTIYVVKDLKKPNNDDMPDFPYDEVKANLLAIMPADGGPVELFPVDNWWVDTGRTKITFDPM